MCLDAPGLGAGRSSFHSTPAMQILADPSPSLDSSSPLAQWLVAGGGGMYRRDQVVSKALPLQFQAVLFYTVWGRHMCSKETLQRVSRRSRGGGGDGAGWPWSLGCPSTVPEWTEPCPEAGSWAVPAPLAPVTLLAWTQWGLDRMVSPVFCFSLI